jgi:hypothetical protein
MFIPPAMMLDDVALAVAIPLPFTPILSTNPCIRSCRSMPTAMVDAERLAEQIDRNEQRIYEQAVRYVVEEKGWRVCFFTGAMVNCGEAISTVIAMFTDARKVRLLTTQDNRSEIPHIACLAS